eukprot:g1941.t1
MLAAVLLCILAVTPGAPFADQSPHQLWQTLDADGSGSLTQTELLRALLQAHEVARQKRIARAQRELEEHSRGDFEAMDLDKDGFVQREEYEADEHRKQQRWLNRERNGIGGQSARAQRLFDFADIDRDGALTKAEWFLLLHPELAEERDDYRTLLAQDTLEQADAGERDGVLSFDEFWEYSKARLHPDVLGSTPELDAEQSARRADFDRHDVDRDARLSIAELRSWLTADDPEINMHFEAAAFVQHADADNDGSLTLSEYEQHAALLMQFLAKLERKPDGWHYLQQQQQQSQQHQGEDEREL